MAGILSWHGVNGRRDGIILAMLYQSEKKIIGSAITAMAA